MNKWYSIENKADGNPVEISIYDEIGDYGTSAKNFIEEVKNVSDRDITLRINSVGGSVFDGLAISHHEIKNPFIQYGREMDGTNNLKAEPAVTGPALF